MLLLTNCCKKDDQEIDLQHPVDPGKFFFHQLEVTIKMFYAQNTFMSLFLFIILAEDRCFSVEVD